MNPLFEKNSGWFVAFGGWLISHCPTAPRLLVYLSIVVAALQIIYLLGKIFGKKKGDEDGD